MSINKELIDELMTHQSVRVSLENQWNTLPNILSQDVDGEKIWRNINSAIDNTSKTSALAFFKIYSIAASVLLMISIGMAYYFYSPSIQHNTSYVVSSGMQRMESLTLPDGSIVKMGPNTKLTYPDKFDADKRLIRLEGQAFITVAVDENKPFIVSTPDLHVTALGTAFEIFNYEPIGDNEMIETILLSGKVKITLNTPTNNGPKEYLLNPNEKLSHSRLTKHTQISPIDADRYTLWRNKLNPSFQDEQLSVILPRLERWYGISIECPPHIANSYRYTFSIRDESLERILALLNLSSPVTYVKDGEKYKLRVLE